MTLNTALHLPFDARSPLPAATAQLPDILGNGYLQETLPLRPDQEGPVVATLVNRPAAQKGGDAVLYVHGYNDYFFQSEMGERFNAAGHDFYALDLRKYGRSWRPGQTLAFTENLGSYYEELDAAVRLIRERDGNKNLTLFAHSTGGLTAALYAHDRRADGLINKLVLNSPFLDFNGSFVTEALLNTVINEIGVLAPHKIVSHDADSLYAHATSRSLQGEWDYNTDWKKRDLPTRAGWIHAVHQGQHRVRQGLQIPVPILLMASARSGGGATWNPSYTQTDTVLDVKDIVRLAPQLGASVLTKQFEGGLHDLTLSRREVRDEVYRSVMEFIAP